MKLDVFGRITLLNILPREGNFSTLKILRDLKEDLSFDEAENKALQFKFHENGRVDWITEADKEKDINIGEKANDIIVDALKLLDKKKKLTEDHFSLYERFVGE
jgi:hypothetical protein